MLAIIGGSGIYDIDLISNKKEIEVKTPFGEPSSPIIVGNYKNTKVAFLPRHGKNHQFLPHEVNYRANILALKKIGVDKIVALSAVGSLQEHIKPSDFCIATQYFDFVKGNREKTFFGNGIAAHVSTANPICDIVAKSIIDSAKNIGVNIHQNCTYGCVDGPRLGSRAESFFLKDAVKCDLVGMTNVPEAFLSLEAQISYCTLCIVTDYDCWLDDPKHHVSVAKVIERYGESLEKAKEIIFELIGNNMPNVKDSASRVSLQDAVLTPYEMLSENNKEIFDILNK